LTAVRGWRGDLSVGLPLVSRRRVDHGGLSDLVLAKKVMAAVMRLK